jgi:hypothetical protein
MAYSQTVFSSADYLIEFMACSGHSEAVILNLIEQKVEGFPSNITPQMVRSFFRNFGRHPHDLQASLTVTRLENIASLVQDAAIAAAAPVVTTTNPPTKKPNGHRRTLPPVIKKGSPGAVIMIDGFQACYATKYAPPKRKNNNSSRAPGVLDSKTPTMSHDVWPAQGSGAKRTVAAIDPHTGVAHLMAYKEGPDPIQTVKDALQQVINQYGTVCHRQLLRVMTTL